MRVGRGGSVGVEERVDDIPLSRIVEGIVQRRRRRWRRRGRQRIRAERHESVLVISDGVDERLHPLKANLVGVGAEKKGLLP